MGIPRLICYAAAVAVAHSAIAQSPQLNGSQIRAGKMRDGEITAFLKRSGRDALSPTIFISSAPLSCDKGASCAFFRSVVRKATLTVTYEIYFASLTVDQPLRGDRVTFIVNGSLRDVAAKSIDTHIDCTLSSKCQALEQVVVTVSRDDLATISKDNSGNFLQMRLFGARGAAPDFWVARRDAAAVLRATDNEVSRLKDAAKIKM